MKPRGEKMILEKDVMLDHQLQDDCSIDLDSLKEEIAKVGSMGKKKKKKSKVALPLPVDKQFENGVFPEGETVEYTTCSWRSSNSEKILLEEDFSSEYNEIRKAAEVHRQVRKYAKANIKPGMSMIQICELIENGTRQLIQEKGLEAGIAFPTGCSLNNVAAHYTPNTGDQTVLGQDDVMKIDFGTHVNGKVSDWLKTRENN